MTEYDNERFWATFDIRGPYRRLWALRGTFTTLAEALVLASTSTPPLYVARGPAGGFSMFRPHELPWGDAEGDTLEVWPLNEVFVWVPPHYERESGHAAEGCGTIGPGSRRPPHNR